jgi:hypothetical protein
MKNDSFVRLLIKYAIVLIITQVVYYVWFYFHYQIGGKAMYSNSFFNEVMWLTIENIIRRGFFLLLAIMIIFDLRKFKIKDYFILPIITFVFGYLGVYLFLMICLYYHHKHL